MNEVQREQRDAARDELRDVLRIEHEILDPDHYLQRIHGRREALALALLDLLDDEPTTGEE